ncbi:MAG: hypothetical protein DRI36_00055 [Caldiserica bacterium]|nr:MAG: hypothetical protein DRI36_00055 [Caldisericota bacterium]
MKRFSIVLTFILTGSLLFSGNLSLKLGRETPGGSALKSFILPGWGQFANGEKKKGYLFGGMTATFLTLSYYFHQQADKKYEEYEKRGLKNDPLYDEYKSYFNTGNFFLYTAIIVWGYNVYDAYRNAKKKFSYFYEEERDYFIVFTPDRLNFYIRF